VDKSISSKRAYSYIHINERGRKDVRYNRAVRSSVVVQRTPIPKRAHVNGMG
jgi:hypothetical protein